MKFSFSSIEPYIKLIIAFKLEVKILEAKQTGYMIKKAS